MDVFELTEQCNSANTASSGGSQGGATAATSVSVAASPQPRRRHGQQTGRPHSSETTSISSGIIKASVDSAKGDTFCDCYARGTEKDCHCGEEDLYFEWVWDDSTKSSASVLKQDSREVLFHMDYSCGTAAVRGSAAMKDEQYYWEVKMTTPVYGTDMMVGVGTSNTDLDRYRHTFCSMLGRDADSWGLSYTGLIHHKGLKQHYSSKFGQGAIIGVHLDMWLGTLSFYKNRRPLGIAYRDLQGKILYPVVSSTAARSGMKVIKCQSFRTSLQFMCCQVLRKYIPAHLNVLKVVDLPPGLRCFLENNVSWLLQPCCSPSEDYSGAGVKRSCSESLDYDTDDDRRKRRCLDPTFLPRQMSKEET